MLINTIIDGTNIGVQLQINRMITLLTTGKSFDPTTGDIKESFDKTTVVSSDIPAGKLDTSEFKFIATITSRTKESMVIYDYTLENGKHTLIGVPSLNGYMNGNPVDNEHMSGDIIVLSAVSIGHLSTPNSIQDMSKKFTEETMFVYDNAASAISTVDSHLISLRGFDNHSMYNNFGTMLNGGEIYGESGSTLPIEFIVIGNTTDKLFNTPVPISRIVKKGIGIPHLSAAGIINTNNILIPILF